ncbi:hypothetical protein L249_4057 [Ophiocordyceps polyrhachis-furcata BCC 54312]|uniref:J domain-containing protein n=1 Tax=Ophiocordyceps polyrhachis-furcata BCC 54312 TaxID=1330021 RepID=A0A367L6C2_9HYPO|nr:hypothetical protein L249_4057 [Ophiocordyceps polyrhachis-furcata BCC 54312]
MGLRFAAMAASRDYYADLELPPTADIQEIKKQFRKLALKYHPDRNPGREAEVNSKFQIIQSAHEVLSDPQQKAKYDVSFSRSGRAPGASGVKGNPWQNAAQNFPPPPRRNSTRNTPSGAQRWQSRFSSGVPPTAKQQTASDSAETKKTAARAFENMRKSQFQSGTKSSGSQPEARPPPPPPPPPPMPPRTESARQRAEAAFGSRKTGYQPRSAMPGDEPPVSSQNYYPRSPAEPPQPPPQPPRRPVPPMMPDPLSQFRARHQSMPYSSLGGEKTNPFDGAQPGRRGSMREPGGNDSRASYPEFTRPSYSKPFTVHEVDDEGRPQATADDYDAPPRPHFETKPGPKFHHDAGQHPNTGKHSSSAEHQSDRGPSMYASLCYEHPHRPVLFMRGTFEPRGLESTYGHLPDPQARLAPSGDQISLQTQSSFERQQHLLLHHLIRNMETGLQPHKKRAGRAGSPNGCLVTEFADVSHVPSFRFPVGDDTFERTQPTHDASRSTKSSTEDINTQFAKDDDPNLWQFRAGGTEADSQSASRNSTGGRANRRSPAENASAEPVEHTNHQPQMDSQSSGFDADGWSDKFNVDTFVPRPGPGGSSSPTRSTRSNSKRVRTKPTVGTAAVVEDCSSEEESYEWRGRNAQAKPPVADSPQAMDIDSPPSVPTAPPVQAEGARNIPVEPSRPEWRPGKPESVMTDDKPERPAKIPINAENVGSEDIGDLTANLSDLRNVAPMQQRAGLQSFADLRDDLPFESKASEDLPIHLPKAQPLLLPTVPQAPRLPSAVATDGSKPTKALWAKYLAEFESYLQKWDIFHGQVVDHFTTRKAHIAKTRISKGYGFLGARGDAEIREYISWVQQDNGVRQGWAAACDEHEQRLREFMAFREKMK